MEQIEDWWGMMVVFFHHLLGLAFTPMSDHEKARWIVGAIVAIIVIETIWGPGRRVGRMIWNLFRSIFTGRKKRNQLIMAQLGKRESKRVKDIMVADELVAGLARLKRESILTQDDVNNYLHILDKNMHLGGSVTKRMWLLYAGKEAVLSKKLRREAIESLKSTPKPDIPGSSPPDPPAPPAAAPVAPKRGILSRLKLNKAAA